MTRCQLRAVAVLCTVAAALAAGITYRIYQQAAWWQQVRAAQVAITANQTSFGGTTVTGQDPDRLHRQCTDAVASYNQAAAHLALTQLDATQECQ